MSLDLRSGWGSCIFDIGTWLAQKKNKIMNVLESFTLSWLLQFPKINSVRFVITLVDNCICVGLFIKHYLFSIQARMLEKFYYKNLRILPGSASLGAEVAVVKSDTLWPSELKKKRTN